MKHFDGRVAAITGAGSGMGRAVALELGRRGCHLALSDIDPTTVAETAEMAEALSVSVTHTTVDVADRSAMHSWADEVVADHGKANLIFNNAGVALGATVQHMSYENLEWLMGINFWGVVHGTKAFLPHLIAAGEGHVVNTSSVFGLAGIPSQSAYNASKFAVRGFTESLRLELDMARCGVSATAVHPGGIRTNIARSARVESSISGLGVDPERAKRDFEKAFITSADKAAQVIVRAVQLDKRRAMVGPDAHLINALVRLPPGMYQRLIGAGARRRL